MLEPIVLAKNSNQSDNIIFALGCCGQQRLKDVTPTIAELHDSPFSSGVKINLQ